MEAGSSWYAWLRDPLVGRFVSVAIGLVLVAVARQFV
jgi:hypothetical protein